MDFESTIHPYIGVTGFTSQEQVVAALDVVPPNHSHQLMVGLLTNLNRLRGESTKWPKRHPATEKLADIFIDHERALNLVHYASDNPSTLADQLIECANLVGPYLHGFQLNITWPSPEQLAQFLQTYPEMKIVFQINRPIMASVENDIDRLVMRMRRYEGLIHYVLFDLSGGEGRVIDPIHTWPSLQQLRNQLPGYNIGVAGGLTPQNLTRVISDLAKRIPDLSIDAESRLRDERDELDLELTRAYIENAFAIFS